MKQWNLSLFLLMMLLSLCLIPCLHGLAEETVSAYVIRVEDQDGEAVPGAYVNLCTDVLCIPSRTDENGVIVYAGEPAAYHLQVLKVPEGYSFDASEEWVTEAVYQEITLPVIRETEGRITRVVRVADQNGEPVPEVSVNFCTDTECFTLKTDEKGQAVLIAEPEIYHLQIVRVPEGFRFDPTLELYTEPRSGSHQITVSRDM